MILEQLIDFLLWCIQSLISEILCLSRKRIGNEPQEHGDFSPYLETQNDFEYQEFPETNKLHVHGEDENTLLLTNAASVTTAISNDARFNTEVRFRTSWFLPHKSGRGPLLSSLFARSLPTTIAILASAIVIASISGCLIYMEIETTEKCVGIAQYSNSSVPSAVKKWRLIGDSLQAFVLNFWFPGIMVLLFGRRTVCENFKSVLHVGFTTGLLAVIYKSYLFIYVTNDYDSKDSFGYIGNAIFFVGVMLGCMQIARVTKQSTKIIMLKVGHIFVLSLVMAVTCRNWTIPTFNEQTSEINKTIVAVAVPLIAFIPVAVAKYVVLCYLTDFVRAEVSFVLVYFNYLIPVAVYRIMQAELTELKYFVAFSLLHGSFNIFAQVTRHFRENLWGCAVKVFEKRSWIPIPYNAPRNKRLQADMEIQDMLSQFGTLILSQMFIMLYRFSTFDVTLVDEMERAYPRVAIGLGIEFAFSWLSTFIQVYLYNIPIKTVWFMYWRRHVFAAVLITVVTISYFSRVLLSVLKRIGNCGEYSVRNCTMTFT